MKKKPSSNKRNNFRKKKELEDNARPIEMSKCWSLFVVKIDRR